MMKPIISALFFFISFTVLAQTKGEYPKNWHLLDKQKDGVYGISLQKAYDLLQGKTNEKIIVAVIDGGVDTAHEDLRPILWHNAKEIPANGKDDDGNGYVDDVYGWNFPGGKDGKNVKEDSQEEVRLYHQFRARFEEQEVIDSRLSPADKQLYKDWKRAKAKLTMTDEEKDNVRNLSYVLKALVKADSVLRDDMQKETYTGDSLEMYKPITENGKRAKAAYISITTQMLQIEKTTKNSDLVHDLTEFVTSKEKLMDALDVAPEDFRNDIVKDDYTNMNDRFYGNGDVMTGTPSHGTHVSGIIGAVRNNKLGVDGIANNILVMTVRAVPNGDEHDKDVALAIRYAVDNGAKVINMSFGKDFSPNQKWVEEAIQYAQSKDVLLVHAAGNDGHDLDKDYNFPTDLFVNGKRATNMITVGSSSDPLITENYISSFSNYGKNSVDIFAPGDHIMSTVPYNQYEKKDGTSMASPVVAGLAGLLRSYFPKLTAQQIKECIVNSIDKSFENTEVIKPGTKDKKVRLASLCRYGGIINAAVAVQNALKMQAPKVVAAKPPKVKVAKQRKG
jgi:cell wall-associated protease